jgi:hypothetical protein
MLLRERRAAFAAAVKLGDFVPTDPKTVPRPTAQATAAAVAVPARSACDERARRRRSGKKIGSLSSSSGAERMVTVALPIART